MRSNPPRFFLRKRMRSAFHFSQSFAIALMVLVCFNSVVEADGIDLDNLLQDMKNHRARVTTYKADFVQTKSLALFDQQKISSGVALYKAPRQMIWRYTDPDKTQMRVDNESVSFYFPELEQIEIYPLEEGRGASFFFAFEATVDELMQNFTIADYSVSEGMLNRLDLNPKSDTIAPGLKSIVLWLRNPDYLPEKILIREMSGDTTKIELSDIQVNMPLADEELNFDAPEGTKVIQAQSDLF